MPVNIYSLSDPETREVRYIGKTVQSLKQRLRGHIRDVRGFCHKVNWIKSLAKPPIITLIEVCRDDAWEAREKFWIAHYKAIGARLTNNNSGGAGLHTHSIDARIKISMALKGRKNPCSPERAAAISRAKKGVPCHKLRGVKRPIDVVMKVADANRGKKRPYRPQSLDHVLKRVTSRVINGSYCHSPEVRQKLSDNHPMARPVIRLSDGAVFPSLAHACRETGITEDVMRRCVKTRKPVNGAIYQRQEV